MEPVVVAILVILLLSYTDCIKHAVFEKKYVGYRVSGKKTVVSKLRGWSTLHCSAVCLTLKQCEGFNFIRDKTKSNEKKVCEFLKSVPETSQDSNLKRHQLSEIYKISTPHEGVCHESNNPCHENWDCFEVNHEARCFKINVTATGYLDAENSCENDEGSLLVEDDTDVYNYIESKPEFASINQVWIWSDNSEQETEPTEISNTEDEPTSAHSNQRNTTSKSSTTTKPTITTEYTNNKGKYKNKKEKQKIKNKQEDSENSEDDDYEKAKGDKKPKRQVSTKDEEDHDGNCRIISLKSRISTHVDCNDVHPYICEY